MSQDPKSSMTEGNHQWASAFQVSACVACPLVSLSRASQVAKPRALWEVFTQDHGRRVEGQLVLNEYMNDT